MSATNVAVRGALAAGSDDAVEVAQSIARRAEPAPASQAADGVAALDLVTPRLIERPAAELSIEEWDAFATALVADPLGATLRGPRQVYDAPELRLVVDAIRLGDRDSVPVADRYFRAWNAAASGPDAIRERSVDLLRRWPDLDQPQWRELGALIDADPVGEVTGLQVQYGSSSLRNMIIDRSRGTNVFDQGVDYATQAQHMQWSRDHDPAHGVRVAEAVEATMAGTATSLQDRLLQMHGDQLDQIVDLLPDRSNVERRLVAYAMANGRSDTDQYLSWMQRFDDEYDAMFDDAIESAAAGRELEYEQQALIAFDRPRLDALIATRPVEERVRIMDQALFNTERSDWMRANDPGWTAKLDEAIDAKLAGIDDGEQAYLLKIEGEHLEPVLARRPYELQRAYKAIEHEHLPGALVRWERANSPNWEAQLREAIQDVLGGSPTEHSGWALRLEADRFEEIVVGRPFDEQARLARHLDPIGFEDWRLANDPVHRATVTAAVDRIIAGVPALAGDADALVAEARRLDVLLKDYPVTVHERIARASLGPTTREYAAWMLANDPNTPARLRAAGDAAVAGTMSTEQRAALSHLGEDLVQVLEGRPFHERTRILRAMQGQVNGGVMSNLWKAQEPERSQYLVRAAEEAKHGELSDDAKLLLWDERGKLDELIEGLDYEAQLRVAEAVFVMPHWLQGWKAQVDPRRVERIGESATRIADGAGTPHDLRVLRAESDVLGVVRDRPYAEQLRVAEVALDGWGLELWKRANDPSYQQRLGAAIDSIVAGNPAGDAIALVREDRANTFRLLADHSPATRSAIAATMLDASGSGFEGEIAAMRELALDARQRLDKLPPIAELDEIRAATDELLDRNIQRMTGYIHDDPNLGYAIHPDYAEMGRVQSNLDLLEAVAAGRTAAASADDVLSW